MAKKSKIAAQKKREKLVAQYAEKRVELKAIIKSPAAPLDERMEASRRLSALPRDSSPVRLRNRDQVDGRPRGYVGKAGVSRIRFREMAHRGELPGITKSSERSPVRPRVIGGPSGRPHQHSWLRSALRARSCGSRGTWSRPTTLG